MHFSKLIIVPLMAINSALGVSTKVITLEAPLSNYTAVEIEWNVQFNPAMPRISVNGTVQDIVAHLVVVHADYFAKLEENIAERKLGRATTAQHRRTDIIPQGTNYYCNNFEDAIYEDIQAGVSYLEGLSGVPTVGPGPGTCVRVSCSWDSAIWWCNDNMKTKSLNSFFDIAIGALEIMEHCKITVSGESTTVLVNGQQFFRDGWNVVITSANC